MVLRKADFIDILQKYSEDYEKYCNLKDSVIFDNDYINLKNPC